MLVLTKTYPAYKKYHVYCTFQVFDIQYVLVPTGRGFSLWKPPDMIPGTSSLGVQRVTNEPQYSYICSTYLCFLLSSEQRNYICAYFCFLYTTAMQQLLFYPFAFFSQNINDCVLFRLLSTTLNCLCLLKPSLHYNKTTCVSSCLPCSQNKSSSKGWFFNFFFCGW